MVINWDYVKIKTLWNYEDLLKKLCHTLNYRFVQEHYNHTMDEATDYIHQLHSIDLKKPEKQEWFEGLLLNFAWLRRVGIQNYLDLLHQVDSKESCEDFLRVSGMGFPELIETLNYLFRWVLPFPAPLREFFDAENATEMAYLQALKSRKISTTLDLLEAGRTPDLRTELANASAIPSEFLLRLIHLADLARLPFVRGKTVRHLYLAGYDTLEKLSAAEVQQMEIALNDYFQLHGKSYADYKSVIPLQPLIHGARCLPRVIEM